jgi:hypothetical protein
MELQVIADMHFQRKLMRLTFTRWQHYHGWWGEVCVYVEGKVREKNQLVLRYDNIHVQISRSTLGVS